MITAREPLAIRAAIVSAVVAVLHVAVVLGALPITAEQETAIVAAVGMLGTAVLVVVARGAVVPLDSVAAREDHAGQLVSGPADKQHRDGDPVAVVAHKGGRPPADTLYSSMPDDKGGE